MSGPLPTVVPAPAPALPGLHEHAALQALLDDGARFDAEYGAGMSNHLPMALTALARLGADDARLREFAQRYAQARALTPTRPHASWPAGDAWTGRFGQRGAWPLYRDLFRQWIAHEGAADVLQQTLPALMPGCAAAAFHGLIRTAAAVQAGHRGELADGLAHWASFFMPLGALPPNPGTEPDPAALLRRLPAGTSRAPSIAARLRAAAEGGRVNLEIAALRIDQGTPARLAAAAALAFAETGNFTALHLVTGTQAMRVLAPFIEEPAAAWRWYWQAYAHGVVAARLQPSSARRAPVPDWPALVRAACASDDEHVIKLVDACREEERHYGAGLWQRAAARAVQPGGVQ